MRRLPPPTIYERSDAIAPFFSAVAPGVVHKDASHDLRGDTREMRPASPIHVTLINKPEICLVNEGGRLQGVPGALTAKLAPCDGAQLLIHHGQELVAGTGIPAVPLIEQRRDVRP